MIQFHPVLSQVFPYTLSGSIFQIECPLVQKLICVSISCLWRTALWVYTSDSKLKFHKASLFSNLSFEFGRHRTTHYWQRTIICYPRHFTSFWQIRCSHQGVTIPERQAEDEPRVKCIDYPPSKSRSWPSSSGCFFYRSSCRLAYLLA